MADWYATSETQAGALAAWAGQQGLRYERYGVLPKVSKLLSAGEGTRPEVLRHAGPRACARAACPAAWRRRSRTSATAST